MQNFDGKSMNTLQNIFCYPIIFRIILLIGCISLFSFGITHILKEHVFNDRINHYILTHGIARELEQKVRERTVEIAKQKKEIIDSIHYAKQIQTAILPPKKIVDKVFPNNFIHSHYADKKA